MEIKELCRQATLLHDSIVAAGVIEDGDLMGYFIRPKMPLQNAEKMGEMVMHANIVAVIGTTNEDFFGEFGYIMAHWKHADAFIFPINVETPKLLAIRVMRPYDHEEVVQRVTDFMREKRIELSGTPSAPDQ